MKLPYPKKVKAPIIHKNSCNYSKFDNVIENIQIHMPWRAFFFFFFGEKFAQLWKINMNGEYLIIFYNKKIRFSKKLKIMLWHYPIGFVW
jgi:hypothetical protein